MPGMPSSRHSAGPGYHRSRWRDVRRGAARPGSGAGRGARCGNRRPAAGGGPDGAGGSVVPGRGPVLRDVRSRRCRSGRSEPGCFMPAPARRPPGSRRRMPVRRSRPRRMNLPGIRTRIPDVRGVGTVAMVCAGYRGLTAAEAPVSVETFERVDAPTSLVAGQARKRVPTALTAERVTVPGSGGRGPNFTPPGAERARWCSSRAMTRVPNIRSRRRGWALDLAERGGVRPVHIRSDSRVDSHRCRARPAGRGAPWS